jgi:hypothetical protein
MDWSWLRVVGRERVIANGNRVPFQGDGNFLKLDIGGSHTNLREY